jgi:hypothetical protein
MDPEKARALSPECLAAEGLGLSEVAPLSARLQRYGTAKGRSYAMAGHVLAEANPTRVGDADRHLARRLYGCGAFLHFRHWLEHRKTTLHSAQFCQVPLLCPLCAIRRSAKLLRRYVERAEFIAKTHELHLVTLTVKNGDDLAERHAHLRAGVRKLRERARKGYGAFAASAGAVWSTELTKHDTGWHPHVHMVWAMPPGSEIRWGEGSQLAADWLAVTSDSFIVHAQRIAGDGVVDAFLEVMKYSLKFAGLELADNLHAYRTLRGKRLLASCGVWYGLELPEDAELADDPLDGPYLDLVFKWAGSRGYVAFGEHTAKACGSAFAVV